MNGAAIAHSLIGKPISEALSETRLRSELARLAPQMADEIWFAPADALREAALEITKGALITTASYSAKKQRIQVTVKGLGPKGHATFHIPLAALEDPS